MRTQKRSRIATLLVTAPIALLALGPGPWPIDPERALLGKTPAPLGFYQVDVNKPPTSGEQALLGKVSGSGVRASATEARNGITGGVALLGG